MKRFAIPALAVMSMISSPITCTRCLASDEDDFRVAIKNWESTLGDSFNVDPYIRAAQVLQKMGKEEACRVLLACTKERDSDPGVPVSSLCRLVFKAKKDSTFRRASIGAVGFLGGTDYKDWALDPFEVIDGVPFVVTDGTWAIGGLPESPAKYLEYCMKECEWNDVKFVPKSRKEKELTLEKLLASKKWQKPLTAVEINRLRSQIK